MTSKELSTAGSVIVTGAGRGLGRAYALSLGRSGGRIAVQAVAESQGTWLPAGFGPAEVAAALDDILDMQDCLFPTTLLEEIQMHTPPVAAATSSELAR